MKKFFSEKLLSLITAVGMLLNSFQPFLFLLTPAVSNASVKLESKIEYYNNTFKFNISVNNADAGVSGKLDYLLTYKTDEQIEAVTGDDVDLDKNTNFSKEIYAGTCSGTGSDKVCIPHNVLRGILKTEIKDAFWLKTQWFKLENQELKIVLEKDTNQLELSDLENYWLENGVEPTPTITITPSPTPQPTIELTEAKDDENKSDETNPIEIAPTPSAVDTTEKTLSVETGQVSAVVVPAGEDVGYYFNPYLITDKPDYSPTDTVILSGTGFLPTTTYILNVSSNDYSLQDTITTDSQGNFVYSFQLDGVYRPNYEVVVKNREGKILTTINFSDTPSLDLEKKCKTENAECDINASKKECCEGLECVLFNTNPNNSKCTSISITPSPTEIPTLTPTITETPTLTPTETPTPTPIVSPTPSPICVEGPTWASSVKDFNQGKRKDGNPVLPERSNPNNALGKPDSLGQTVKFVSLGDRGSIVLEFSGYVVNVSGNDLSFHEITWGSYPEEKAKVEVSQDGTTWVGNWEVTNKDGGNGIGYVDFSSTGLSWVKYVRITDTTDYSLHGAEADGYDLDAVDATNQVCEKPVSTVTLCKTDQSQNPLSGWRLYLLGNKVGNTINVPSKGNDPNVGVIVNAGNYPTDNYVLLASGTYNYGDSRMIADAANSYRYVGLPCAGLADGWVNGEGSYCMKNYLSLNFSTSGGPTAPGWGTYYNPQHKYAKAFSGGDLSLKIWDTCSLDQLEGCYGDNEGSLKLDVYKGYVGDTGQNGCVTFEDVPYGEYQLGEILQEGWEEASGSGKVDINSPKQTFTIVNNELPKFGNLEVTKIVDWKKVKPDKSKNFKICITGPSYPSENCKTSDYDGEKLVWDNIQVGQYTITETNPGQNWIVTSSPQTVTIKKDQTTKVEIKNEVNPITIKAYKVVCPKEADLPNWSGNRPITPEKINQFLSSHPQCSLSSDWKFQWGFADKSGQQGVDKLIGTHIGEADGIPSSCSSNCGPNTKTGNNYEDWKTFGPTGNDGIAEAQIGDLQGAPGVWVREVLKENYIPFTYPPQDSPGSDVSAEMFCHNDVGKYDNFDLVGSPQYGGTYYCVSFNALKNTEIKGKKFNDLNRNGADDSEPGLKNWKILAAQKVDEINVAAQNMRTVTSNISLESGQKYLLRVSGTFGAGDSITADAKYSVRAPNTYWTDYVQNYESYGPTLLDLQINNSSPNWGSYNPSHVYWLTYNGGGSTINFRIYDIYPSNNSGSLNVKIYKVLSETTTADDGSYTLSLTGAIGNDVIVAEETQEGYVQTAPTGENFGYCNVTPYQTTTCNFGNFKLGYIQGRKYQDLNQNGSRDDNEPWLSGWTINLYSNSWQYITSATTSGSGGLYRFENLGPGTYYTCEVLKQGWKQTGPTLGGNRVANQSPNKNNEGSVCWQSVINNSGQGIAGRRFGNINYGSISGYKYEDINGNGKDDDGTENRRSGWTIFIDTNENGTLDDGETLTQTNGNGNYTFNNLLPGDYQVCEVLTAGWIATDPAEGNCKKVTVEAGNDTKVNFGNFELGTVTVTKFHDRNQDGTKDSNEEVLGGWTINLASDSGTLTQETASPSGQVTFNGLLAGNYTLSEDLQTDWTQTNIYCDNYNGSYQDNTYSLTISSGANLNCYLGNYHQPYQTIAKANNVYPSGTTPGSIVTFTLKLKVYNNNLYNAFIKDILPPGFTFNNVWSATINGASVSLPNPNYASPGTWQLGDLKEGDEVVINYQAKVKDTAEPGLYKDLAWAVGSVKDQEGSEKVLALATDSGSADSGVVSENFVGTKIAVNKDTQNYTSIDIKKEETKKEQGEVLGASTGLPATGGKIIWIIIATLSTLLGSLLIFVGLFGKKLNLKKITGFFLALVLYTLLTQNALAGSLSVRLSEPKSPTRFNTFDLNFVALDLDNKPITVDCYYKKGSGVYAHFDTTKNLTAGGNVGSCRVTSSQINEDGKTYYFYVTASNGTETINSEIVSVDFNTQGPGTPTNYSKDKTGTCQYKIKFKTADDGGKTTKVEVYRSKETNFGLDSGTRVATISIGSNTEYTYTDNLAAECEKDWHYAVRAFDNYGNGSGWVGDTIITVITTTTTTTTTTGGEAAPTSGAIPVANVTLPAAETTETPEVLGEKTTTGEAESVQKEEKKTVKSLGEVLGETVKKESKSKAIFVGLGIVLLAIIGYAIYKKNKSKIKDQISK